MSQFQLGCWCCHVILLVENIILLKRHNLNVADLLLGTKGRGFYVVMFNRSRICEQLDDMTTAVTHPLDWSSGIFS